MFTTFSDVLNSSYPIIIYLTLLFFTETLQFHSRFRRTVIKFLLGRQKKLDFSILFVSVTLCNINAIHFSLSLDKHFLQRGGRNSVFNLQLLESEFY